MKKPATAKRRKNGAAAKSAMPAVVAEARKSRRVPAKKSAPPRAESAASHASRDRRLRFAELLLSISQKMSGMDSLDEVLTGLKKDNFLFKKLSQRDVLQDSYGSQKALDRIINDLKDMLYF